MAPSGYDPHLVITGRRKAVEPIITRPVGRRRRDHLILIIEQFDRDPRNPDRHRGRDSISRWRRDRLSVDDG